MHPLTERLHMSALTDLEAAAATAPGGPYTVVPNPQDPQGAYYLVPSTSVITGYPLHLGAGSRTVAELQASIDAGEPVVSRPSVQQISAPVDNGHYVNGVYQEPRAAQPGYWG